MDVGLLNFKFKVLVREKKSFEGLMTILCSVLVVGRVGLGLRCPGFDSHLASSIPSLTLDAMALENAYW